MYDVASDKLGNPACKGSHTLNHPPELDTLDHNVEEPSHGDTINSIPNGSDIPATMVDDLANVRLGSGKSRTLPSKKTKAVEGGGFDFLEENRRTSGPDVPPGHVGLEENFSPASNVAA